MRKRGLTRQVWAFAAALPILFALPAGAAEAVAHAQPSLPTYQLRGVLSLVPPQVEGTMHVTLDNTSARTLEEAVLVLFPQRFAAPDAAVNDFNRPFVYPYQDFEPGALEIIDVRDDGRATTWEPVRYNHLPDGMLVRARIARVPPGRSRRLTVRFRTRVPERFGAFGLFDQQLTLVGGWYPYLARLDADGEWRVDGPPPLADFDINLQVPTGLELVINGQHFGRGHDRVSAVVTGVHYATLLAAPRFEREETMVGATRIVFLHPPARRAFRVSLEPPPTVIMLDTLRDAVARRPPATPDPPSEILVVQAPLRLYLTAAGEGSVLVSDRALKMFWIVRPFHELQVAQGVYRELLRPQLAAREPDADFEWLSEGLSRELARRYMAQVKPGTRTVYDWIELFNIFSVVDRFESEPHIPFTGAFFEQQRVADPLAAEITTFNERRPPGRVILSKLRQEVGSETYGAIIDRCVPDPLPFRPCATAVAGRDLDWLFAQWLQPYPRVNYRFERVTLNQPGEAGFRSTIVVRRDASRPLREPVTVRLRSLAGREIDVRWEGQGDRGELTAETRDRVWQARIDPERELIEERRDDNAHPFEPQIVLDSAEVEVSSTEFGFSVLGVARNRYDYRKDLAAAGFYTNRSIGFTAGGRWHGGTPIDSTRFRHNAYLFYSLQSLDGDFTEEGRPERRTDGQLAGLGLRYDYTNVYAFDDPHHARTLRLYGDWYDDALGSDFDYGDWGVILAGTEPLWSYRSTAAMQLINGFSEPIGGSRVPNQGLYSLGGSRSIRGIGAEEQLGRNILVVRGELRQDLYPEVDLNLLDLLVMRRPQLRLFADAGRVNDAAGRVYDVSRFAVGVGIGFAAVYEFMGFFPSLAYLEVATRVDERDSIDDIQVLFGSRQAF